MLLRWCGGYGGSFSYVNCCCIVSTRGADFDILCTLFTLWIITAMDTGDPPGMFIFEYLSCLSRSQNHKITVVFLDFIHLLGCLL